MSRLLKSWYEGGCCCVKKDERLSASYPVTMGMKRYTNTCMYTLLPPSRYLHGYHHLGSKHMTLTSYRQSDSHEADQPQSIYNLKPSRKKNSSTFPTIEVKVSSQKLSTQREFLPPPPLVYWHNQPFLQNAGHNLQLYHSMQDVPQPDHYAFTLLPSDAQLSIETSCLPKLQLWDSVCDLFSWK